jgi:periplasmic protein TonB
MGRVVSMSGPQTLVPKKERALATAAPPRPKVAEDPRQRRMMVIALSVLLVALGFVLYRDRDFWFPDTEEVESEQPVRSAPVANAPTGNGSAQPEVAAKANTPATNAKHRGAAAPAKPDTNPPPTTPAPPAATATRTVLPPLEVEVVAGDTHRTIRPGTNSVRVELQPGAPAQPMTDIATPTAGNVTSNAAERVQLSVNTADVVTHPVKPGYPLLARQMKVQGSVVLRALISKEGTIQDLHVVSGPAILASAAQDAVRQWRFKPHYVGNEPVETQANITVNFTISTN